MEGGDFIFSFSPCAFFTCEKFTFFLLLAFLFLKNSQFFCEGQYGQEREETQCILHVARRGHGWILKKQNHIPKLHSMYIKICS